MTHKSNMTCLYCYLQQFHDLQVFQSTSENCDLHVLLPTEEKHDLQVVRLTHIIMTMCVDYHDLLVL